MNKDSGNDDNTFVVFGGIDWWYHNRAHIDPQLTRRFAKKGKTLYINSIVMTKFKTGEKKMFLKKVKRKLKSIFTGLKKTEEGFWVYSPFSMPVHHIFLAKWLNDILLSFQIRVVTYKLGINNPVVIIANPAAVDVALRMKKLRLIYQRTDRFEEADGVDVDVILKCDRKLKAKSDLTFYVNNMIYNEELSQCKRAIFLDHGVDFDKFALADRDSFIPAEMTNIPKPIIGYFGTIYKNSVDIELAAKVADLLPGMSFVYIGTLYEKYSNLSEKNNVWMLGQKTYDEIPHYGKCFDVAILPWNRNRWTEASNPIKVKEYLALGKPFVCTPYFSELENYRDVAYVGESPKEFAECIKKALQEDSLDKIEYRRKKIEPDTWDSKAEYLLKQIF